MVLLLLLITAQKHLSQADQQVSWGSTPLAGPATLASLEEDAISSWGHFAYLQLVVSLKP